MNKKHNQQSVEQRKRKDRTYVTTFRQGALGATVWLRTGAEGLQFLCFTISRSFRSPNSGKEGYSSDYFDYNDEAIATVSKKAADFVRQYKDRPEDAIEAGSHLNEQKKQQTDLRTSRAAISDARTGALAA